MTDKQELLDKLKFLMQLDIDAVHAYQQAIDHIDQSDEEIRSQLMVYQADHENHIDRLAAAISDLGAKPPARSRDIKGFALQGLTAIRSMSGTEGAMKVMESNEKMTNKEYEQAHIMQMPSEIKNVINENFGDEQRHLHYVREVLSAHAWQH